MSPLPRKAVRVRRGVYQARDGRLYLRAEVTGPDDMKHAIGPRLAAVQPSGRTKDEREAAAVEAERELLQRIAAVRRGDYQAAVAPVWTVRTWAEYIWTRSPAKSADNRAQRAEAWLAVIGDKRLDTVTPTDIEQGWDAVLAVPGRAGGMRTYSTLKGVRAGLSMVFNPAAERGLTDGNPFRSAILAMPPDTSSPREAFALSQIAAVFAHLPDHHVAPFLLQWCCGMRVNEAFLALWDRVDVTPLGTRYTIPAESEKTGTTRRLTLPPGLVAVLEEHRAKFGTTRTGPIFPSPRTGGMYHDASGSRAWTTATRKAGLASESHDLRANFEQTADRLGVRAFVRDTITGHSPSTMGDHYNAVSPEEVADALALVWEHIVAALHESVPHAVPLASHAEGIRQ